MAAYGEASLENSSTTRGIKLDDGRVYDPVKNTYMPGRQYRLMRKVVEVRRYTKQEAMALCAEAKHYGPWQEVKDYRPQRARWPLLAVAAGRAMIPGADRLPDNLLLAAPPSQVGPDHLAWSGLFPYRVLMRPMLLLLLASAALLPVPKTGLRPLRSACVPRSRLLRLGGRDSGSSCPGGRAKIQIFTAPAISCAACA